MFHAILPLFAVRLSTKKIMALFNLASHIWIIMPVVITVLGIGIISASVFLAQHTEDLLHNDFGDAQKRLTEHLQERTFHLFEANLSVHDVAEIVGSALDKELSLSSAMKINAASSLFTAFSTIRLASQISYVSIHGDIFSYLHERNQTRLIFSNDSSNSFNSTLHPWYTQMVDNHTGKGYGDVLVLPYVQPNNSQWFLDALEGRSRGPSYGYGWGYDRDEMLFFTAPADRFSVVALGIKLKDFINYLFSTNLYDARAYLSTKNDVFLDCNTRALTPINASDILPVRGIISDSCSGIIDAQLFSHSSSRKHFLRKGGEIVLYCAPIHIAEIQMAIIIAFPVKNFLLILQEMKVIIVLLLSFYILIGVIGSCISSSLLRRLQRDKLIGLANLIKQMEATEQAERKSMNKSRAFTNASHDIRASLACIAGLIKLCCVNVLPDSDAYRNLIQMDSCTTKLLGILNSVLEISKMEAGRIELDVVEFSMAQTIEESVDIFHVVALAKGVEVIWDPCDFSVLMSSNVRGDCRRFKQILDNLLSNAIKFTSEGHVVVRAWAKKVGSKYPEFSSIQQGNFPNIWVHLSRCFCYVGGAYPNKKPLNSIYHGQGDMEFTFEIDDTGTGIPTEKSASIFKDYIQVKESNLGCEGTGLGLGIVKSYVQLMGGGISIKDKQPGERGSCFMFNIFLESNDVSSNNEEESFDSCNIPILNRLHSFSTKTKAKVQSNIHALAISQGITVEGIQCLLAIRRSETSRILKDWMKILGIMVSVAQQPEHMYVVLKRMTRNCSASGSCDSSVGSSGINSEYSSPRDENGHVLTFNMKDDHKKASLKGLNKYLLVIIDLDFGNFSEIHSFLTCLAKGNHHFHQYKVICLTDSTASCLKLPCDLVLHKPIHGSRFYKILGIMQEFRQTNKELKLEIAGESTELETKRLLNSACLQQSSCKVLKDGTDTEPLSGMKILLVEDTLLLCQIAEKVLSRAGGIITSVDNGSKALEVVTSRISEGSSKLLPFDLILMDCQMPVMNGYVATQKIRKEEQKYGIHIPIIALSAHAEPEEVKKSLLCGMDYHLTKPIQISKLLEAIKLISQTLN